MFHLSELAYHFKFWGFLILSSLANWFAINGNLRSEICFAARGANQIYVLLMFVDLEQVTLVRPDGGSAVDVGLDLADLRQNAHLFVATRINHLLLVIN